jgi:hypothetical protein
MYSNVRFNYSTSAQLIAADEWRRAAREKAEQDWLIEDTDLDAGSGTSRIAAARQTVGLRLIRAGERLRGTAAAALPPGTVSAVR